jgi:ABC-2 type transport system ATP-binding protein
MQPALLLEGVSKSYSGHTAVHELDLTVPAGTIYGILGPNGAGKSTTLRMVMNIIGRDSGRVSLLGADPQEDRRVLRRIGYLPEERGLYKRMKVIDTIIFFARLKGMSTGDARREGERWLDRMGLAEWKDAKVETLSKGMQQKAQFISTVVHAPELLILDEPTSGLDPVNQEVLRDSILEWKAQGRTVIFSTHNMAQAEELCDAVCIIAAGDKVLDGDLGAIRRSNRGNRWRVEFDDMARVPDGFVNTLERFGPTKKSGRGWEIELRENEDEGRLLAAVADAPAPLLSFERVQPTLHEIFVQRVGTSAATPRHREVAHV